MIHYEDKDEYFITTNFGNRLNLKGWKLFSHGGQKYIFPAIEPLLRASVSMHSGPDATGMMWTRKYVWNDEGDKAISWDPAPLPINRCKRSSDTFIDLYLSIIEFKMNMFAKKLTPHRFIFLKNSIMQLRISSKVIFEMPHLFTDSQSRERTYIGTLSEHCFF